MASWPRGDHAAKYSTEHDLIFRSPIFYGQAFVTRVRTHAARAPLPPHHCRAARAALRVCVGSVDLSDCNVQQTSHIATRRCLRTRVGVGPVPSHPPASPAALGLWYVYAALVIRQ